MKPASFDYLRAGSVTQVLDVLAEAAVGGGDGDTKVLAGGQSLMALMNLRLARPALLVDIGGLAELTRVFDDVDRVVIGALVRHRTVETDPLLAARIPLAAAAARYIGHIGIRNRGTLGGTLAHADPAGELPMVMVTLGATLHVESRARGRRDIPAEQFFVSFYTSALEPDELVTWVSVPAIRHDQGWGFMEYAPRHGDFAVAGAGALLTLAADGTVARARAALLSAADRPLLVSDEADVRGQVATPELWESVARHWARHADPAGEDPAYVRALSEEALVEALDQAHRRALATAPSKVAG